MRLLVATLAAFGLAALAAGGASAHGDPAGDYLTDHTIFFPIGKPLPERDQAVLASLVAQAARGGYPLRVAVIGSRFDLGTEGDSWGKPQEYADGLDQDLVYYFRGPLLVAMPAGFGLRRPGKSVAADRRLLADIPVSSGPDGLALATELAIERLAAAHGVTVAPPRSLSTASDRNRRDRIVIGLAAAAGILLWWLVRLARRRASSASARPA